MNRNFAIQSIKAIFENHIKVDCFKLGFVWDDENIVDEELGEILDKISLGIAEEYERDD